MADRQHLIEANGEPLSVPPRRGAHYIDLDTGDQYQASGTLSVADWRLVAQVSSGTLSVADGEHVISQTTRAVNASLFEGAITLNLSPALMRGCHSFELFLDGETETPVDVFIQGPSSEQPIELGNISVQGYTTFGGPGAHGPRWQLVPGPNSWLWARVLVVDGTVHILEQASE